jgi:hypothetical protein
MLNRASAGNEVRTCYFGKVAKLSSPMNSPIITS